MPPAKDVSKDVEKLAEDAKAGAEDVEKSAQEGAEKQLDALKDWLKVENLQGSQRDEPQWLAERPLKDTMAQCQHICV
jgi:hypothetical protein